jgi:hypothetical protein
MSCAQVRPLPGGWPIFSLAADVRDWCIAQLRTASATQPRWHLMFYSLLLSIPLLYLGEGRDVNVP